MTKAYPITMEISGSTALWTRPDTGDSPTSYIAPTYCAVKGIFESILWGPAVEIIPTKVEICAPIQWHSYVTNYGGPLRSVSQRAKDSNYQLYATVLTDVCYRLYAQVTTSTNKQLTDFSAAWSQRTTSPGHAYAEQFARRLNRGQSYASLCLGWKEFTPSYFGPFREETKVCKEISTVIPSMLREVFPGGHHSAYNAVYDTNLQVQNGVLVFPKKEAVKFD